jgi:hypothetical protein
MQRRFLRFEKILDFVACSTLHPYLRVLSLRLPYFNPALIFPETVGSVHAY